MGCIPAKVQHFPLFLVKKNFKMCLDHFMEIIDIYVGLRLAKVSPEILLLNFLFHGANSIANSFPLLDDCQSLSRQGEAQLNKLPSVGVENRFFLKKSINPVLIYVTYYNLLEFSSKIEGRSVKVHEKGQWFSTFSSLKYLMWPGTMAQTPKI